MVCWFIVILRLCADINPQMKTTLATWVLLVLCLICIKTIIDIAQTELTLICLFAHHHPLRDNIIFSTALTL